MFYQLLEEICFGNITESLWRMLTAKMTAVILDHDAFLVTGILLLNTKDSNKWLTKFHFNVCNFLLKLNTTLIVQHYGITFVQQTHNNRNFNAIIIICTVFPNQNNILIQLKILFNEKITLILSILH